MLRAIGKAIIAILIALAIIAAGGWYVLTQTDLLGGAATNATNALFNSGIATSQIESAIRANEGAIAQKLGMSESQVDAIVDDLDIGSWKAVDKPAGLTETDEVSFDYEGTTVNATLYDDSNYVTIDADGQEVTLQVPDSAAAYLSYLQ